MQLKFPLQSSTDFFQSRQTVIKIHTVAVSRKKHSPPAIKKLKHVDLTVANKQLNRMSRLSSCINIIHTRVLLHALN